LITQKDIERLLRYAVYELPTLENRIQTLTRDAIDMEWRKERLRDEILILTSSISQLKKSLNRYERDWGKETNYFKFESTIKSKKRRIRRKTNYIKS
jgi:predicted  nucleic acid-binding Zn-ribbon protein